MTQGISDRFWRAEARSEETKHFIRDIKRITRRKFTPEEKIRIVLEGFRRDTPIRDICRREGIRPGTYYAWLFCLKSNIASVEVLCLQQADYAVVKVLKPQKMRI